MFSSNKINWYNSLVQWIGLFFFLFYPKTIINKKKEYSLKWVIYQEQLRIFCLFLYRHNYFWSVFCCYIIHWWRLNIFTSFKRSELSGTCSSFLLIWNPLPWFPASEHIQNKICSCYVIRGLYYKVLIRRRDECCGNIISISCIQTNRINTAAIKYCNTVVLSDFNECNKPRTNLFLI